MQVACTHGVLDKWKQEQALLQNTEEQKSDVMDPPSALPCFNLFKAAETVAAEKEREAESSTGTSRFARACVSMCEELGLEDVNKFLNLPAQSSHCHRHHQQSEG